MKRPAILERLREAALGASGSSDRTSRQDWFDAVEGLTRGEPIDSSGLAPAIVDYLETLALRAHETTGAQLDALRAAGLSDDGLFEITVVAAVASGLERNKLAHVALASMEEDR